MKKYFDFEIQKAVWWPAIVPVTILAKCRFPVFVK